MMKVKGIKIMNSIFTFVILIILIILVGFFTSSETAYLSLPKLKVRSMVEERKPYAKIVYKLKSLSLIIYL